MNFLLLLFITMLSTNAIAAKPDRPPGQPKNIELPKIMYDVAEETTLISENNFKGLHEISVPGASFVKVHFEKFNIPKGVIVRVRNPAGTEVYDYARASKGPHTKRAKDDGVHSFSAMSISGDTAIVEVLGYKANSKSLGNRLKIDLYSAGLPQAKINQLYSDAEPNTESTCGTLDRVPTPCIVDTYPTEYERMRPVARISNGSGSLCTAWRVGASNRLFTNHHCNDTQADIAASEVWFNYEFNNCSWQSSKTIPVKVAGDTLLTSSQEYDMALFTVKDFALTEPFGYFGIEIRNPVLGERIYRGGHGGGLAKQATIESDRNTGGFCQVDDVSRKGYTADSDMGYWCDSEGGSSGSPVMLGENGRVIALHHFGGCMNAGVKMKGIWPLVSEYFGGVIPNGDTDPGADRIAPVPDLKITCSFGVCEFDSTGSTDADGSVAYHKWDFGDGEAIEAASGSKIYDTTGLYTVSLFIKDNDGNPGFEADLIPVTLDGGNIPPVSRWTVTDDGNYTGFFSNDSFDWDGEIVESCWRYKDSSFEYGPYTCSHGIADGRHRFQVGGAQVAALKVTDVFGDSTEVPLWVTINGPVMNTNPVSSMTITRESNDTFTFTDTSTDSDGSIVKWIFWPGESPPLNGQGPHTKTYVLPDGVAEKDYSVYLWAYDNWGVPDISRITWITVTAAPDPPPVDPPPIDPPPTDPEPELVFTTQKIKGAKFTLSLAWSNLDGESVDVYKWGSKIATVPNIGIYSLKVHRKDKGAAFKVCTDVCTNSINLRF